MFQVKTITSQKAAGRELSYVDGDFHFAVDRGVAIIAAVKWNGLLGLTRDRHANEIPIADDAVGRIEFDPAGAGQINLAPRMR